jgi:hypothetical protein
MMRRLLVPVLLVLVGVTACGKEDTPAASSGAPTTTTTTEAPSTTTSVTAAPSPGTATQIQLAPDGFVVIDDAGEITQLLFDTPLDDVVAVLSAVLGPPKGEGPESEECGSGADYNVAFGSPSELTIEAIDDQFAGWMVREGSTLKTVLGIGPGSTKDEMAAAHGPVVIDEESTLGVEFVYRSSDDTYFAGFLTEDSPTGVVTDLFAGATCFFR